MPRTLSMLFVKGCADLHGASKLWRLDQVCLACEELSCERILIARITASSASTREDINAKSTRRASVDTYVTIRSFLCTNKHQLLLLSIAFCPHPWQDDGGWRGRRTSILHAFIQPRGRQVRLSGFFTKTKRDVNNECCLQYIKDARAFMMIYV